MFLGETLSSHSFFCPPGGVNDCGKMICTRLFHLFLVYDKNVKKENENLVFSGHASSYTSTKLSYFTRMPLKQR